MDEKRDRAVALIIKEHETLKKTLAQTVVSAFEALCNTDPGESLSLLGVLNEQFTEEKAKELLDSREAFLNGEG